LGHCDHDPFTLIRAYRGKIKFNHFARVWEGVIYFGTAAVYRKLADPLGLAYLFAEMVQAREEIQGDQRGGCKSLALADLIAEHVERPTEIYWTRPRYPVLLKEVRDNHLGRAMDAEFSDVEGVNDYILSNNVTDDALLTESLIHLIRGEQSIDVDEVVRGVLLSFAITPPKIAKLDEKGEADYFDVAVANTSSGAVNVDPTCGKVGGTKFEMQSSAAKAAAAGVPLLNYEAHPKGREVIKKNKKVRQIVCEPYPVMLKDNVFFGHVIKQHGDVVTGNCCGMSRMEGKALAPLFKFYLDARVFEPGLRFDDFLSFLEENGLTENDIKSFERYISLTSGLIYVITMAASVEVAPVNVKDAAQVLAHYYMPFVKFRDNECYSAEGSVMSGDFKTLDGNTKRHKSGYTEVSYIIQKHGMVMGTCGCKFCDLFEKPREVTWMELSRVVGGCYLGDDQISVYVDLPIAAMVDLVLGTITTGGRKNAFYEQGDAAEFLRVQFGRNLDTYRDPVRVFAKLRWGMAKYRDDDFLCALQSASLELGPQREANERLHRLSRLVGGEIYNEELQEIRGLPRGEVLRPYTVEEVAILQAGGDKVLLEMNYVWHSLM